MSTNAVISILDEGNRTMTSIGLACDGYFSHAGKVLLEHYTSDKRVKSLMKLGNLLALNPKIPHHLPSMKKYKEIPLNTTGGDNRLTQVFGERLTEKCIPFHYYAYTVKTEARVTKYPSNLYPWNQYHYVWNGREWLYPSYNKEGNFVAWKVLTNEICEER